VTIPTIRGNVEGLVNNFSTEQLAKLAVGFLGPAGEATGHSGDAGGGRRESGSALIFGA